MNVRNLIAWSLMIVVPTIVWSVYVYVSRMTRNFSDFSDYSVLAIALALGVAGILTLIRAPGIRVSAALLYIVLTTAGLYGGMFISLCYLGDCP